METVYLELTINRNSAIPLYFQFKQFMIDKIEKGELKAGDLVPTEEELCKLYHISRPTIRQAFGELVNEGYMTRKRALGTFISHPKLSSKFLNRIARFDEEMETIDVHPITLVKKLEVCDAPDEVDIKLHLHGAQAINLNRLRLTEKGVPFVYEETYMPYHLFRGMEHLDYTEDSMYLNMEAHGHKIGRIERAVTAIAAEGEIGAILNVPDGYPILSIVTVGYSVDDVPIEHSTSYNRSDVYCVNLDIVSPDFHAPKDIE